VLGYLMAHGGGDAVRHIGDMRPPSWDTLSPTAPFAAAFLFLIAVCLGGVPLLRPPVRDELALAAVGLVLFARANRFLDVAAILLVPLAVRCADALVELANRPPRTLNVIAFVPAIGLLSWFAHDAQGWWGPTGRLGLRSASLPLVAGAVLTHDPPSRVLSTYEANGPLGFWTYGRSRVYVDGETPLFYDDTDYGVAREAWFHTSALEGVIAHDRVDALVLPRDWGTCGMMAQRWKVVAVEPGFTTFRPRNAPGVEIVHLDPCSAESWLKADACSDGGSSTRQEIDHLSAMGASPLWPILRSELELRCTGKVGELPSARASWELISSWNRLAARKALQEGRAADAWSLVEPQISDGDVGELYYFAPKVESAVSTDRLRRTFDKVARKLDDEAPPRFRVMFAELCVAQDDVECVRVNAMRAAARGERGAIGPLAWLAEHDTEERFRNEAARWRELLSAGQHAAPPDVSSPH
jgi:hypothetical protein